MPKAKIPIPPGYDDRVKEGTTALIDIPKDYDEKLLEKYIADYLDSRYGPASPTRKVDTIESKGKSFTKVSPPISGGVNLKQSYSLLDETTPGHPRPAYLGRPTFIPLVSPAVETMTRAVDAPISGKSYSGRAADVLEGVGTAAMAGFAPEIGANPATALKGALLGTGTDLSSRAGVKVLGGDLEQQRLAGDVGGFLGSVLPAVSPKVSAGMGGMIPGAYEEFTAPVNYRGLNIPRGLAGAGVGATGGYFIGGHGQPSEIGAAIGATLPAIKGAFSGFSRASQGMPWLGRPPVPPIYEPQFYEPTGAGPNWQVPTPEGPPEYPVGSARALPAPLATETRTSGAYTMGPESDPRFRAGYPPGTEPEFYPPTSPKLLGPSSQFQMPEPEIYPIPKGPTEPTKPVEVKKPETKPVSKTGEKQSEDVKSEETKKVEGPDDKESEGESTSSKDTETKINVKNKEIDPEFDRLIAKMEPSWEPGKQISYPHLKKIADAVNVKATPLARSLLDAGYDVVPSKFGDEYGRKRVGKKDVQTIQDIIDKMKESKKD